MNKSASRAVDILTLIAKEKRPLSLSEICAELDLPKSSAFDLVYTLIDRGFLEQDSGKLFSLGLKTFEIGSAYLSRTNLFDVAHRHLQELSKKVGDVVFLGIENDYQVVYLDRITGPDSIAHICEVGARNYMHCTGLGKALLSGYPEQKVRGIIEKWGFVKKTENTITSFDRLFAELEEIRKNRFAVDNCEGVPELYCVASPIFGTGPEPIAAISVASFKFKIDPERYDLLTALVPQTAMEISLRMGCKSTEHL